ncbi:MAG: winged helix DNA-binding domain-containing protein [Saprospiraceae bacterium]
MIVKEIIARRLFNQQIAETKFTKPEEIVSYLGAMQAQDWHMAKWAIGLRLPDSNEADIENAFNEGKILRMHMMRPTWHFVCPKDIRWMLELTSPRVQAFNASYYRKQDLEQKTFKKCNAIIAKALRDHRYLTRNELREIFAKEKINTDDLRLTLIMMNAELEGLICSGPRKGKQFTYALLDEKTPATDHFKKEEALYKLTSLYFRTRGPATISDYTWWSGLKVKEAKEGISSLGKKFLHESINGREYIYYDQQLKDISKLQTTFLIPDYDEYGISYKDRRVYNHPKWNTETPVVNSDYFHAISIEGHFGGTWNKQLVKGKPVIDLRFFENLPETKRRKLKSGLKRYREFCNS